MTCLNSTNVWLIRIQEPDQEIWGEESSYKVRSTQDSFGAKWRAITKADPLWGEESSYKVRSTQDSFGAKWHAITKADPLEVDPTTK